MVLTESDTAEALVGPANLVSSTAAGLLEVVLMARQALLLNRP